MSLYSAQPQHFMQCLLSQGASPDSLVPRHQFATYLEEDFYEAIERGKLIGIEVCVHQCEVGNLYRDDNIIVVQTATSTLRCSNFILCLGHLPPATLLVPGAIRLPEDFPALTHMKQNTNVAIIGAGLTAVDAILSLNNLNYKVSAKCFTRKGGLPEIQARLATAGVPPAMPGRHPTFDV